MNEPHTKTEYEEILKTYRLDTASGNERAKNEFRTHALKFPHRFAHLSNCVDCTGNALFNCKNVRDSFTARKCEDVRYFESGNEIKDSYDLCTGGESSLCYEGLTPDNDYRALFTIFSLKNQEVEYCQDCHSSKNLFGCISIKKGEYYILNKQYSKEEHEALVPRIRSQMMAEKSINDKYREYGYGEFFPIALSTFGYNETMAFEYYPLSREEVLSRGWKWQDKVQFTSGKETIKTADLPDSILDVPDSISKEILACSTCQRNYRIIPDKLTFYRKVGIPLPRQCFYCRNSERLKLRNPYELWDRICAKCGKNIVSSYSPDRLEIIYCEQCYNAEVA